ncbi:CCC motif membrane protein [Formosa sp. 3Alg 14/1]|uniref:CCC motif membrane protein n=1 Tax=Formosa sp. 3Alg 14/1 TaxID=3382190 RepID=UPI0039BEC035
MERIYLKTTAIYVLAGLGLLCCCFGGLGVIPAGIAFYMAHTKLKEVALYPENYDNVKGMSDAKTVALIILIICALNLLYTIYAVSTADWEIVIEQIQDIMNENRYEV